MRPLVLVVLAASFAFPQTIVDRTFVMRADTTSFDPYSGMTHVCVLVYPDGKYRLERSFQPSTGGALDMRVYLDQLPEADLKQLQAALDDHDFQGIHTPERHGGIIQDLDQLTVTVPRERAFQNIDFENAGQRKPYEKSLKPLLNWMKDVQKRKVKVAKEERSDNCQPPRVMYRGSISVHSDDKDDPDQR
jgi:hypothetical protein